MSAMDDKWRQLEEALSSVFSRATVRAGGHVVNIQKSILREKLVIAVFVDGWIKGEWTKAKNNEPVHPEARFYRPVRSRIYPLKKYAMLKKAFGQEKADEMTAMRIIAFTPYWNSPRSLVRHLKKHFPDLELQPDD